MKSMIHKEHL